MVGSRRGVPGVLCKLDVEKSFDHVSWDFHIYICYSAVGSLINGESGLYFVFSC